MRWKAIWKNLNIHRNLWEREDGISSHSVPLWCQSGKRMFLLGPKHSRCISRESVWFRLLPYFSFRKWSEKSHSVFLQVSLIPFLFFNCNYRLWFSKAIKSLLNSYWLQWESFKCFAEFGPPFRPCFFFFVPHFFFSYRLNWNGNSPFPLCQPQPLKTTLGQLTVWSWTSGLFLVLPCFAPISRLTNQALAAFPIHFQLKIVVSERIPLLPSRIFCCFLDRSCRRCYFCRQSACSLTLGSCMVPSLVTGKKNPSLPE